MGEAQVIHDDEFDTSGSTPKTGLYSSGSGYYNPHTGTFLQGKGIAADMNPVSNSDESSVAKISKPTKQAVETEKVARKTEIKPAITNMFDIPELEKENIDPAGETKSDDSGSSSSDDGLDRQKTLPKKEIDPPKVLPPTNFKVSGDGASNFGAVAISDSEGDEKKDTKEVYQEKFDKESNDIEKDKDSKNDGDQYDWVVRDQNGDIVACQMKDGGNIHIFETNQDGSRKSESGKCNDLTSPEKNTSGEDLYKAWQNICKDNNNYANGKGGVKAYDSCGNSTNATIAMYGEGTNGKEWTGIFINSDGTYKNFSYECDGSGSGFGYIDNDSQYKATFGSFLSMIQEGGSDGNFTKVYQKWNNEPLLGDTIGNHYGNFGYGTGNPGCYLRKENVRHKSWDYDNKKWKP